MHLNFMKPDVWDGLVIGAVLIGASLAVLRLISDRATYRDQQAREARKANDSPDDAE